MVFLVQAAYTAEKSMQVGHSHEVYAIQLRGKYLVSGSLDKTLRVWDLEKQRLVGGPLLSHNSGVLSLQFDPQADRDILFSGDASGRLLAWRFSTRAVIQRIDDAHNDALVAMRLDGDRLVTSPMDRTIKI